MAIKKIPCGGWLYDDESITFEDGVMKVVGGGGGGGNLIVTVEAESDMSAIVASSTYSEMVSALLSGRNVTLVFTVKGFEEAPFVCTNTVLTVVGMEGTRKIWWTLSPDSMNIYCTEADLWTVG